MHDLIKKSHELRQRSDELRKNTRDIGVKFNTLAEQFAAAGIAPGAFKNGNPNPSLSASGMYEANFESAVRVSTPLVSVTEHNESRDMGGAQSAGFDGVVEGRQTSEAKLA